MRLFAKLLIPAIFLVAIGSIVYSLRVPAAPVPACALGSCPLALSVSDNGKTFTYGVNIPFSAVLQETKNPQAELRCKPEGILDIVPDSTVAPAGLYRVTFKGVPGTCYLEDKNFGVTIVISGAR